GDRADGRADRQGLHRGDHRPGFRAGRAGDPDQQEEPAAAALRPAWRRRWHRVAPGERRGGGAVSRRGGRAPGAPRRLADAGWQLAAGQPASEEQLRDLEFAWRACRAVKSNAILLASGLASVGVGMGQVNRVDAARLAVARAGDRAAGSVAASDAYFPFPDGLEVLAEAGVLAVVEPGGSVRDDEVIAAAESAGVTLYFTAVRHFWH